MRILGEEAEDQAGEEVVQVLAAGGGVPLRVNPQQFDVEAVEAAGGLDVEGVLADLPDCQSRTKLGPFPGVIGGCDRGFGVRLGARGPRMPA